VSSSSGPTPRTDAAGAFDPQLGGLLIFGGRSPDGSALGDTWINAGGAWSYRSTGEGALSPSARWGAALTYDSAGGFLLLFGGRNSSNTLGDTWAFNATGWHPLSSPSAPSGRAFASIAYDPDLSAVVLFGGLTGGAIPTTSNQTWLFDSTGWVDATGQFDSPPAARAWAAEAYDASDGYLLLFGGSSSPSSQVPLGGTWILSPRGWWNASKPDAPGPTARLGASLAFDASTGSLVLFGGAAASPTEPDAFPADTWSFAAGVWNDLSAGLAMHPPGREGAVWAPAGSGLLLFGGDTGSPAAARADAWRFSAQVLSVSLTATPTAGPAPLNVSFVLSVSGGATPYTVSWQFGDGAVSATLGPVNHVYVLPGEFTASVTVRDSSADSSVQAIPISVLTDWQGAHQWSSVDAAGSAAPSPRASSQIAYDAALQAVILFGGETAPGAAASDTWEFVNNVWINLTSSLPVSPSGRYGGAMVYDSVDSVLLLFGGTTGATTLNDTWTFDGSTWTEILPITAPSPRAFAQMSYDPIDGYVVLFGGGAAPVASVAPPIDSDTWEFRAGVWVNITSQLSIAPPPTTGGTFTWDPQDGVLVLSGGSSIAATGAPGTCYPDGLTWSFVAGAWTAQEKTAPTGRVFGMAAYDGTDHVVLVFGGSESRSGRCTVADDSWSYVGGGWSNLSGAIPFPPASRDRAGLAFDAAEGVDVLFGGASAGVLLNDTWLYPAELNSSTTSTTTNTTGSGNLSSGPPPSPGGSGGNGPPERTADRRRSPRSRSAILSAAWPARDRSR